MPCEMQHIHLCHNLERHHYCHERLSETHHSKIEKSQSTNSLVRKRYSKCSKCPPLARMHALSAQSATSGFSISTVSFA